MTTAAATTLAAGLACPACGSQLRHEADTLRCSGGHSYAVELGIPDLRTQAVRSADRAEDLDRARQLDSSAGSSDFAGLLREHWRETDRAPELVERFVASDLSEDKGEPLVHAVERGWGKTLGPDARLLELGCGSGWFASVAAARGAQVVAGDISMRWLVVARKRLEEEGANVRLVCFDAEQAPFADDSFDVVVAADVIEHVPDQAAVARSCARVLRPGGLLFVSTPNRFSLGLEPHVRLWGVGYLPRGLARRYVHRVRRSPYEHVRLLSAHSLRRLLDRAGFDVRLVTPEISESRQRLYRGPELSLVRLFNRVRTQPVARKALELVGPFFHAYATKRAD